MVKNYQDIEKALIGIWLQDTMLQYTELFEPSDFFIFRGTFQKIKDAVKQKKPISLPIVTGEYKITELAKLVTESYPSQIETYVEEMQEIIADRKFNAKMKDNYEGNPYEKASQIIDSMREVVPTSKAKTTVQHLIELADEIPLRKLKDYSTMYGIPKLDMKTNGLHKTNLVVVAGRPSVGKSAFALQVADNVLKKGKKVLFVSLEISATELLERWVMHITDIDSTRMKSGELTEYRVGAKIEDKCDWGEFSKASDIIAGYKLEINTSARTIAKLRVEIARENPDLVIIDQISFMSGNGKFMSKREEFVNITRNLKILAMDFNIPIVALAQINRDASENYPTLANLKESGSIEEDANVVIMLHKLTEKQCRDDGYDFILEGNKGNSTLIIIGKNRSGEIGNFNTQFIGSKYKFYEMA